MCGWWDYENKNKKKIEKNKNYFKTWIPKLKEKESYEFINNVLNRSEEELSKLKKWIELYEKDKEIEQIVIVTHTCPILDFVEKHEIDTVLNTGYDSIVNGKYKKLTTWIYGHTHVQGDKKINNIRFLCHPRGRPKDYNREMYTIKLIDL